jgi:hypothetical protein
MQIYDMIDKIIDKNIKEKERKKEMIEDMYRLMYVPGGPGYEQSKQHFENLV